MKGATIDNLPLSSHQRYARDQIDLDARFVVEAQDAASHLGCLATSAIYTSKWEELFELQLRNLSWASFQPPPKYREMRRRLFAHSIFPYLFQQDEEDQENASGDERDFLAMKLERAKKRAATISEKDERAMVSLFEMIRLLNRMLEHIHGKKLQYHKG